jgi:hypothetical protein
VIDETQNVYEIDVVATNCGSRDGTYTGYALLNDAFEENDVISYGFWNERLYLSGNMLRIP